MLREFLRLEAAAGILLFLAAILALALANSPLSPVYGGLLDTTVAVQVGALSISKPLLLWINDGLMALFFFLIGLEVKREVLEGELSSPAQIVLPGLGALGGIAVPAAIYSWFNWGDSVAMSGWAVPAATDIAFALGVLGLFGKRVPAALKVFLLTLAIFDDLAAIVIIAVFYAGDLSGAALGIAAAILGCAVAANVLGVRRVSVYVLIGIALWVAVLKSGVHATLAGVLIAWCIPLNDPQGVSPLKGVERDLHTPVAYAVLPLFAFANAGLALEGMGIQDIVHPVTLGVIGGLVLGNPVGVLLFTGTGMALGLTRLPAGVNWLQMAGVAFICGIGFTMSLFIAGLAFEHAGGAYYSVVRLGILIGSALAASLGCLVLWIGIGRADEFRRAAGERQPRSRRGSSGGSLLQFFHKPFNNGGIAHGAQRAPHRVSLSVKRRQSLRNGHPLIFSNDLLPFHEPVVLVVPVENRTSRKPVCLRSTAVRHHALLVEVGEDPLSDLNASDVEPGVFIRHKAARGDHSPSEHRPVRPRGIPLVRVENPVSHDGLLEL